MKTCSKRDLEGGVLRCEREQGHSGAHGATSFHGHERTWDNLSEPRTRKPRRKSVAPLRQTSDKQRDRTDALTGIMAERINASIAFTGVFACECYLANREPCGKTWSTRQKALDECDPHHLNRRRGKPGSKRADFFSSDDAPVGIAVVSKVCHREIESSPRWSGATA